MTSRANEKMRTYMAPSPLYDEAMRFARENDESLSKVIRRALDEYVAENRKRQVRKNAAAKAAATMRARREAEKDQGQATEAEEAL